jgi:hypothetical protein
VVSAYITIPRSTGAPKIIRDLKQKGARHLADLSTYRDRVASYFDFCKNAGFDILRFHAMLLTSPVPSWEILATTYGTGPGGLELSACHARKT